jgi:hypothetical protein
MKTKLALTIIIFLIVSSCSKEQSKNKNMDDPYLPYNYALNGWKVLESTKNNHYLYYNFRIIDNTLYCLGSNSTLKVKQNNVVVNKTFIDNQINKDNYVLNKNFIVYTYYNYIFIRSFEEPSIFLKIDIKTIDTSLINVGINNSVFLNNKDEFLFFAYSSNTPKLYTLKLNNINNNITYTTIPNNPNIEINFLNYFWNKETNNGKYLFGLNETLFLDFEGNEIKFPIIRGEIVADYFSKDTTKIVYNDNDKMVVYEETNGTVKKYNVPYTMDFNSCIYNSKILFPQQEKLWVIDYLSLKYNLTKEDFRELIFDIIVFDNKVYVATSSGILYKNIEEIF